MSEEAVKAVEAAEEAEASPTITIAEKQSGSEAEAGIVASEAGSPETEAQPTITIAETPAEAPAEPEDVHYQAVEKEGTVTALWEMQGQKHLRTIDPRSVEGKQILALFETAA
ncbi:MAG: hypothetical protein H7070_05895 [Saprospiraceae bacterium]|nr:hypothetical protein [Pyrinomonadaceae bacterium]